jgi:hypothetical protein
VNIHRNEKQTFVFKIASFFLKSPTLVGAFWFPRTKKEKTLEKHKAKSLFAVQNYLPRVFSKRSKSQM